MAEHKLYDKKKICYTEVMDFTDFQGIGRDPLYKRYDSVRSVVDVHIDPKYRDFLAHPIYIEEEDRISWFGRSWEETPVAYKDLFGEELEKYKRIKEDTLREYCRVCDTLAGEDRQILMGAIKYIDEDLMFCYDDKVVMVAWGMMVDTNQHVVKGKVMRDLVVKAKHKITFIPGEFGELDNRLYEFLTIENGSVIRQEHIPAVRAYEGYVFAGWEPEPYGVTVLQPLTFYAQYNEAPKKIKIHFVCNEGGELVGPSSVTIDKGACLPSYELPSIEPHSGFQFDEWLNYSPEIPFNEDAVVTAKMRKSEVTCRFDAGENGVINGQDSLSLPQGSYLHTNDIPKISPKRGYKFVGWNTDPLSLVLDDDMVFVAQYEEKVSWFKRFWKWLLWLLMALLLLLLLFFLCKDCSCQDHIVPGGGDALDQEDSTWIADDPNVGRGGIYDPENPYRPVPTPPEYRDILPPAQGVLPPLEEDPEIDPENPGVIANRLNILMENADKSILDLARAFKEKYPDEKYQIIYYDDVIKRMQITLPSSEREKLKRDIPQEFAPEFELFVFDESMFEGTYSPQDPAMSDNSKSWYLDLVNAFEGWDITMGSEEVVVAIVDNGFNLEHPELKSKVILPYNVWLHSPAVSPQSVDHGTHVAGTALALADNGEGLCGIAPECRFIPVQVANAQGVMTTTSILDGVLYAVYQGADVLNISLGQMLSAISGTDENFQQQLIRDNFKEEERLWREVSRIAATHKTTIVVAAGNDSVLAGIDALQRPDNFIVVSAVDKNMSDLNRADFSNYGGFSTISAPGVDIYSTVGENDYVSWEGTSMAAPIVSGTVALMKSLDKTLTSPQIIAILKETGLPVNGKIGKLVQIDKALQKVKTGNYEVTPPVPSSGDVQVLLSWNNYNDLDLMCTDPNGEMIWYKNKLAASGGQLEIDMNVEYPGSSTPIEHIYWPTNGAPNGTYNVYVKFYKKHEEGGATPFKVKVKYGAEEEEYEGALQNVSDVVQVCSFTLGEPTTPGAPASGMPAPGSSPSDDIARLEQERDRLRGELERIEGELNRIRNMR